ncbi:CpaD family pilus assembly protein [uncultured Roseibium sp.]|uniref:CpaD family pilus assembly protein n=1 Tax=uncultured Roseibium sp. TaxID=1936171 RepID=UPI00338D4CF6
MSLSCVAMFPKVRSLAVCLLGTGLLAGCQTQSVENQSAMLAANDYQLRHPIVITEQPETLDLPIGFNTRGLNRHLSDSVAAFASQSKANGDGKVEILVPSGSGNEAAVHAVVPSIRAALKRGGVSGRQTATRSYRVEDASAEAPIRLSYARVMATAGSCGEWPKDIGGSVNQNNDYYNFGCAYQANLAAMVSNPADLITPRASTPSDQMRRAVVYEKFRAGEVTASEYKEGDGATVSE